MGQRLHYVKEKGKLTTLRNGESYDKQIKRKNQKDGCSHCSWFGPHDEICTGIHPQTGLCGVWRDTGRCGGSHLAVQ